MHSTPTGGGIHHLRENDDLQAKISNLTMKLEAIELKKVNEVIVVPQVPSVPMRSRVDEPCIICDDPTHSTINCPNLPQVKGAMMEAHTIFQTTKAKTSKTKAFQIKPLSSKIKVLKDFL